MTSVTLGVKFILIFNGTCNRSILKNTFDWNTFTRRGIVTQIWELLIITLSKGWWWKRSKGNNVAIIKMPFTYNRILYDEKIGGLFDLQFNVSLLITDPSFYIEMNSCSFTKVIIMRKFMYVFETFNTNSDIMTIPRGIYNIIVGHSYIPVYKGGSLNNTSKWLFATSC